MEHQVLEWRDFGLLPTAEAPVVVNLQHVVREELAEAHFVGIWLRLQLVRGGQTYRQIVVLEEGGKKDGKLENV